jgi:c-di-GMP-binding flagellar brake protein YcgR
MPFIDTHPADIDRLDPGGSWARFRFDDRRRVLKSLRALCQSDAPFTIGLPQGPTLAATLWSVDEPGNVLHFTTAVAAPLAPALAAAPRLWAVAYEEEVKMQFELRRFVVERTPDHKQLLHAVLPASLYALPRRGDVRVKPAEPGGPRVRFRHPLAPERWTQMRAIDLGARGCALWRPIDALPLPPGLKLEQAEVELDDQTFFYADLRVQHVTIAPTLTGTGAVADAGVRVGCRWTGLAPTAEAALGQWMKSGQRRRQRLSLDFGQ